MVWSAISWYLLVVILGLLVFPLTYRLFPGLNDRGYAFSRTLGLLLWGYIFWLLSSFGFLTNNLGGYLLALILLLALVGWALQKHPVEEIIAWLRQRKRYLLAVELLFIGAFVFLLLMRAMQPELVGTEKPMELAFISAIMRSPSMPPLDPWLADYSISYYYFGYVIVSILAKITLVPAGVAFNLGISLVFALSALGSYGIVYNLLAAFQPGRGVSRAFQALRGPVFVLLVSNLEGFLEFLHGRGFLSQTTGGEPQLNFWTWLNIKDLASAPLFNEVGPGGQHWWWWRASRVIYDMDITGNHMEVIDEFPFFSYFLADLHPHVLAMPFIFLALALALNLFLYRQEPERPFWVWTPNFKALFEDQPVWKKYFFKFSTSTFLFSAVLLGGLAFLNIWDWPWYVGIFSAAYLLRRAQESGWGWERLWEFVGLGLLLGLAGGLVYLPYFIGFSSQAGGILPNVINPTRGAHLWVMFGVLFLPIMIFLLSLLRRKRDVRGLISGFSWTAVGTLLLLVASVVPVLVVGWLTSADPTGEALRDSFLGKFGEIPIQELLQFGLTRRTEAFFGLFTLMVLLSLAGAVLWPKVQTLRDNQLEVSPPQAQKEQEIPNSHLFIVLLVFFGGLLVIIPEFFYLRDLFGTRMNTIFKFYYQAWLLWGVAAAYGSAVILNKLNIRSLIYGVFLAILLTMGLTYPLMAVNSRIAGFQNRNDPQLNLDGTSGSYYYPLSADEKQAVLWLEDAPLGTLVEAVGGSYSSYARISTNSGQPALLGWPGHEDQWRGSREAAGSRKTDVSRLYTTPSWSEADQIIQQYGIRYIVVGNLERTTYQVREEKFSSYLTTVFQSDTITIYQTSIIDW
jgi:YYY domain-containing protein